MKCFHFSINSSRYFAGFNYGLAVMVFQNIEYIFPSTSWPYNFHIFMYLNSHMALSYSVEVLMFFLLWFWCFSHSKSLGVSFRVLSICCYVGLLYLSGHLFFHIWGMFFYDFIKNILSFWLWYGYFFVYIHHSNNLIETDFLLSFLTSFVFVSFLSC